jgi:hypothetical protein
MTAAATGLVVGTVLPEWTFEVTPTMIVTGAIYSRNYRDVHHASDRAQARGSRDIFMSITTTNGHVGRYVTDWAGPDARLLAISVRLGASNYPYDTCRYTGRVTAVEPGSDGTTVTVAVTATNSLGEHVTATVRMLLPAGEAR